jgi:FixJ family two-component response regulator
LVADIEHWRAPGIANESSCVLLLWKVAMSTKPSIAVVDDDESVREATTRLLRSLGFIANAFSSADELLKSDCLQVTSCLVADIQMPGISGLALYRQLIGAGIPIPTILITAYPGDAIRERALNAGVAGYLVKPFGEKELLDCIETALKHQMLLSPVKTSANKSGA